MAVLQRNELFPISVVSENKDGSLKKAVLKYYDRVNSKELVVFFRQLATLIEAKVPLMMSLTSVGEQTSNSYLKRIIREMVHDVEDGSPFSKAMEKHKDIFSELVLSIIKAGEHFNLRCPLDGEYKIGGNWSETH